jgi:serine/threonine protein phosphatase PrpC
MPVVASSEGQTDGASSEEGPGAAESDAPEGVVLEYYGRTDVGLVREHNEDNFLVADLTAKRRGNDGAILRATLGDRGMLLAVCDGMGGAAAGEVASQMAVDTIYEMLQSGSAPRDRDQFARRLVSAIEEAGTRIFSAAKMDRTRRGMGTTATVAGLVDSLLFVGQVGDSRAYVLRGDQFALITKDQSLVNQLIEAGQLTEEEAEQFEHSNIILQALGTTEEVTVDLTFLELRRGDRLLMCSDGLSGLVHADMMKEVLKSTKDLSEAAQQLIGMANAGGGHDNITVIVAELDGRGLREATADARVAYQQYPLPPDDASVSDGSGRSATAIKSGGPKPGADVKTDGLRDDRVPDPPPANRWWLVAVLLLVVLMVICGLIVLTDDGEHSSADDDEATTRVTIASEVSARAPGIHASTSGASASATTAAEGRIIVHSDTDGVLFVNGAPHGEARGGARLSLPAGAYRLELRQGEVRIAESTVTLAAGQESIVDLSTPAGTIPEPAAPVAAAGTAPTRTNVAEGAHRTSPARAPASAPPPNARAVPPSAGAPPPNVVATPRPGQVL